MSTLAEVKRAYTERTRQLHFLASAPVKASSLPAMLKPIRRYNEFVPAKVARAIQSVDPKASVYIGREGSPVLYIKTTPTKQEAMKRALRSAKADEVRMRRGWIRAWWD